MKKQKRNFSTIFAILLVVMTSCVLLLYDNVRTHTIERKNFLDTRLDETLQLFTLAKAKEVDPDYKWITYEETLPEYIQTQIDQELEKAMEQAVYYLDNDQNFVYEVKNNKTKKVLSQHQELISEKDDKSKYHLYTNMSYDEQGALQEKGNQYTLYYDEFDIKRLLDGYIRIGYGSTGMEEPDSYVINGLEIKTDLIKINPPTNVEITYIVPEELEMSGFVYSYINSWDAFNGFTGMALMFGSGVLALFLLFYPIRIVEETQPFASEKKWKSAVQITLLSTGITFAFMGVITLTGNTLNGYIGNLLQKYEIIGSDWIVMGVNFVVWLLTFYLIAIAMFQIKYIFVHGFWRYLKEDTLIGCFFHYVKEKINVLTEVDLSDDLQKHLLKLVLVHMVIIMVITTTWVFGYVLSIIYAGMVFVWMKKKVDQVQQDYYKVSNAMKELGNGNFEVEINEDAGMFNSLKDEFGHIRLGFEKAVQEETKSQNMKTELISNVSHDLKTPLTCIKNYIVLLQDDHLDEATRHEYLDNLNQYSNRLTTLIEDLFDVSKVNSGNMKLERMNINLVALIEQAQAECMEMLEEKELCIVSNYASHEIQLYLDGGKTYRIFENLFTNIGKYAMPHSRVYIDVNETTDMVHIAFKNISYAQMNFTSEEIVDRFVRGDKSRHEGGSGLGLAIVKSFVEVQGGKFEIQIDGDLFKALISFPKTIKAQKD